MADQKSDPGAQDEGEPGERTKSQQEVSAAATSSEHPASGWRLLISAACFVLAMGVAWASTYGMYWLDLKAAEGRQTPQEAEKAIAVKLKKAKELAAGAAAGSPAPSEESRAADLLVQAVASEYYSARLENELKTDDKDPAASKREQAANGERKPTYWEYLRANGTTLGLLKCHETTLQRYLHRAAAIGTPAALVMAVLLICAAFVLFLRPWSTNQLGQLSAKVIGETGGAVDQEPAGKKPWRSLWRWVMPTSSRGSSLGGLATRVVVVTTAVAVTVGTFSVDVPSRSFTLDAEKTRLEGAEVTVGRFSLQIPGTSITIPAENVVPAKETGSAEVGGPQVAIHIPDVAFKTDGEALRELSRELAAYREVLVKAIEEHDPTVSKVTVDQLHEEVRDLQDSIEKLPTQSNFKDLEGKVAQASQSTSNLQVAIRESSAKFGDGAVLHAIERGRSIRLENHRLNKFGLRSMWKRVIDENCKEYEWLLGRFGGEVVGDRPTNCKVPKPRNDSTDQGVSSDVREAMANRS